VSYFKIREVYFFIIEIFKEYYVKKNTIVEKPVFFLNMTKIMKNKKEFYTRERTFSDFLYTLHL